MYVHTIKENDNNSFTIFRAVNKPMRLISILLVILFAECYNDSSNEQNFIMIVFRENNKFKFENHFKRFIKQKIILKP